VGLVAVVESMDNGRFGLGHGSKDLFITELMVQFF